MSEHIAPTLKRPAAAAQTAASPGLLQRTCACGGTPVAGGECAECRKKRLQRAPLSRFGSGDGGESRAIPAVVHDVLRSTGQALDPQTRSFMEPRFGHDFSRVRVHTGGLAADSARAVSARAYTVGRDIVFGSGEYAPSSSAGRGLLAHELTHVVQQAGAAPGLQPASRISRPDDAAELQAEAVARQVSAGLRAGPITVLPAPAIQRQEKDKSAAEGPEGEDSLTRAEEIRLSKTSPGEVTASLQPFTITLSNFAINRAELKEKHTAALDELGRLMKHGSPDGFTVLALGHTDDTGSAGINDPLSLRRADSVRKYLAKKSGVPIESGGLGETLPEAENESVAGRSRNRRVEIHFVYTGPTEVPEPVNVPEPPDPDDPPPPTITPPPTIVDPPPPIVDGPPPTREDPPPGTQPPSEDDIPPVQTGDDQDSLCESYPIICAALTGAGVLAGAEIGFEVVLLGGLWAGLKYLLPKLLGPKTPQPPSQPNPPPPHPCPIMVRLPGNPGSGPGPNIRTRRMDQGTRYGAPFTMHLMFLHDPRQGCDCSLGEYMQEVRGYFEDVDAHGNVVRAVHQLYKTTLDEHTFNEDGVQLLLFGSGGARQRPTVAFGHRSWINTPDDKYLPDRPTGCTYRGSDAPSTPIGRPGATVRIYLEFRGAPVDKATRSVIPDWDWYYWTVIGNYTTPGVIPPILPIKKRRKKTPPTLEPGFEITPVPTPYDVCPLNGIEIGCQAREHLEHWESPDRDIYLPAVLEAIEIEKSRLVTLYVRDSGVPWEEIVLSPEFQALQDLAQQTACRTVFTAVDMTDLIAVYCDL